MTNTLIAVYIFGFKVHKKIVYWLINGLANTRLISEAFWMSVLSKSAVEAIDDYHYKHFKKYQGKDFNSSALNDWESAMVNRFFSHCRTMLVLASGGGREVYALLKKGFEVDGYECNAKLVEFSQNFIQEEGLTSHIEWVAPNHCPDNGKTYDGIILGWGAYIHVRGKNQRINLLKEINTHLLSGSPFLLSFWYASEMMDNYCSKLTKYNQFFSKIFRTKPIEKGDRLSPFSGHYFTLSDVAEELNESGFSVIYQEGYPYGHIVAQKK